ncbi:MAG: hypothetical protein ABSC23_03910 [Bryobacteraceae bacterium]|jgi:microcompartment protein CcmL/EutN
MDGQLSMFDVPDSLPYQPHSATSKSAAEAAAPRAVTHRSQVLALLSRKVAGMTDEEIQAVLKIKPPGTARARRVELVKAGKVRDSGRTRQTTSGRAATIWEAVSGDQNGDTVL